MDIDYDNLAQMFTSAIPHVRELGLQVVELGDEGFTVKVDQQARFIGDPERGVIHGGIVTVLLDTVSGGAIYLAIRRFTPIATLDLRIDYLKPARPKTAIYAKAHCYRVTRNVAFTHGVAYQDSEDDPIAQAAGSFMLSTGGPPLYRSGRKPAGGSGEGSA